MKIMIIIFNCLFLFTLFIGGCQKFSIQSIQNEPLFTPPNRTIEQLNEIEKKLVVATNEFSFSLFSNILKLETTDKNIFFSPLSIAYALGMVENGAANGTFDSIVFTLHQQGLSLREINTAFANLSYILADTDQRVIITIANSLWPRKGKELHTLFTDVCQQFFRARVKTMDWSLPGAADTVNNWVKENTNGKINEIIRNPVSQSLALLLLNAIYFKGDWTIPFDTASTDTMEFSIDENITISWPTMYKSSSEDTTIRYKETDLFEAVSIPYGEGKFQMTLLLPDRNSTVFEVIASFSESGWEQCMISEKSEKFDIFLPKVKYTYETDLNDVLSSMGMRIVFNPAKADFSAMFKDGVGWIDKVKHKAFIQIDETGTEAAGVTAICMYDSAPRTISFNRPFIFIIHEKVSQTILFMGKIAHPVWN